MPVSGSTAVSGTGGFAVIDDILLLRLKTWSVSPVVSESAWGDSDSAGYTVRKRAREDCTCSLAGVLDSQDEAFDRLRQGFSPKIVLWQSLTSQDYWFFPSTLITAFNLTVDMDSKEVIEWSSDFNSDGPFYAPGQQGTSSVEPDMH